MSITSYSQNFEDVILWRALKHIKNGFYIDIGAQDPVIDSVSMAFYDNGWRGCHVEPTDQYAKKLRLARPDEKVIQKVMGVDNKSLTLYEFPDTGFSTVDKTIADSYLKCGYVYNTLTVPVISMDQLLDEVEKKDIHWLKVDVEGSKENVFQSWKESIVRPWVLIIESIKSMNKQMLITERTKPIWQKCTHQSWEALVLNKGYEFVYFDGKHRYYISNQHQELKTTLSIQPNIFDGFMSNETNVCCCKVNQEKISAESCAEQAEVTAEQTETKTDIISSQLHSVYSSSSWRYTKPLRNIRSWFNRLYLAYRENQIKVILKNRLKIIVQSMGMYFIHRPKLRKFAITVLRKFPELKLKLKSLMSQVLVFQNTPNQQNQLSQYSPRVVRIFKDLKIAIATRKNDKRL